MLYQVRINDGSTNPNLVPLQIMQNAIQNKAQDLATAIETKNSKDAAKYSHELHLMSSGFLSFANSLMDASTVTIDTKGLKSVSTLPYPKRIR